MNLLSYYFVVGGEKFEAERFSFAAMQNGFQGGKYRSVNNIKKLKNSLSSENIYRKILPGITGTNGDSFMTWQTALVDYAVDRDAYLATNDLGMTTEFAQSWLREEEAILKFLGLVKEKLPRVTDFCKGECFSLLTLIYGYDEADGPGGGHHYSEVLIRCLGEMNAGLSTDSGSFELHFERLRRKPD